MLNRSSHFKTDSAQVLLVYILKIERTQKVKSEKNSSVHFLILKLQKFTNNFQFSNANLGSATTETVLVCAKSLQ